MGQTGSWEKRAASNFVTPMQTSFARQTKTNLKMQIALFFAERLKKPECVLEVEIELTLKFQGSDASLFTNILVA